MGEAACNPNAMYWIMVDVMRFHLSLQGFTYRNIGDQWEDSEWTPAAHRHSYPPCDTRAQINNYLL